MDFFEALELIENEYTAQLKLNKLKSKEEMHLISELGVLIKKSRKQQKMTIEELSDLSEVSYSTISRIEKGSVNVQFANVLSLAEALGIKLWIA